MWYNFSDVRLQVRLKGGPTNAFPISWHESLLGDA